MADLDTLENPPGRQIPAMYHRDEAGLVHACRRTIAGPGKYLVWTDCLQDVPPDRAFTPTGAPPKVTCPRCREGVHEEVWGLPRTILPSSLHR
jgi:hypothetical protein